ncbi:MAG: phosphoadenosine phosphosulfate reductase family protein [Methanobrevibacter sp.]|nr:phosphoadenosine phosphosulfate reductase family protein [Clostridia bacterium]MBQ6628641.1 phosphoadenosine phosphosulfate reductase family protein [Methanobrevibacter sp.]
MIIYKCENCNLEVETSECPICHNRTALLRSEIYWSTVFNTPSFFKTVGDEECKYISTDIRPVFPEERLLIEVLLGKSMEFAGKSVWNLGGSLYIIDGKKLTLKYKELTKRDPNEVIAELEKYKDANQLYVDSFFEEKYIKSFIEINKPRLSIITYEAKQYIKDVAGDKDPAEMFVSFSGGKDSTVTSHLVMEALGTEKIVHIYGDTTLEYPTTYNYVKRFRKQHNETPVLVARNNEQNFNNLCELIGPPSRVLRWCCTVFKTGAITKKIESTFKDKKQITTFYGIRRSESKSRSKYDRESDSPKITKQKVVSPIIDWIDFDIWLYLISNKLDFNYAYRQGFARVGCWCCPNNSGWSGYLSAIYMNKQYKEFYDILYNFAKQVGKEDWKEYVDEGSWKARQGGNGLSYANNSVVEFKPCAFDDDSINFDLLKPIDEMLYELFKPFGTLNFEMGNKRLNEVYVLDKKTNQPIFKLTGKVGSTELKVTILKKDGRYKLRKIVESYIKCQITKFQTCIACSACQSVCRFDALTVSNLDPDVVQNRSILYNINSNKCVGCLECVTHFDSGCYMKKVLRKSSSKE